VTFTRPEAASSRWGGVPDPDQAAPAAIAAYLGAYGPATAESFGDWMSGGWFGKRRLRAWFEELGDRLAEVAIESTRAHILADDLDELASTRETSTVRLLPGFDQYVLGPGTADGRVVPAARRSAVSRQSGWISPVVVSGGAVCGTWELDDEVVRVAWFGEAGAPPRSAIGAETERLGAILDRRLRVELSLV
jgi:hypothetical protein